MPVVSYDPRRLYWCSCFGGDVDVVFDGDVDSSAAAAVQHSSGSHLVGSCSRRYSAGSVVRVVQASRKQAPP